MFQTGILDVVGRRTCFFSFLFFFLISFFLSGNLKMGFLFLLTLLFFFVFFFLSTAWARPKHPERCFVIGFLVSILHTFLFLLAGAVGLFLATLVLKFSPVLLIYLKQIFPF